MPPTAADPLRRLCVLRLSALGDVCHVLPVVRTLQDAWRGLEVTWIIGRLEHRLLGHLPDVEFVVFDKKAGPAAYRELRARLAGRRYDALLHMQLAIRASLAAAQVPASIARAPASCSGCSRTSASRHAAASTCSTACSASPRRSA
jgi:heptosyltransferase I